MSVYVFYCCLYGGLRYLGKLLLSIVIFYQKCKYAPPPSRAVSGGYLATLSARRQAPVEVSALETRTQSSQEMLSGFSKHIC